MNSTDDKTRRFLQFLPYALLFFLGTFYLWKFTWYIFFYQEKSSLFLLSMSYLQEHLSQPGGFLIYLAELQTSLYFYPFIGATLVLLEICGIIFLLQKIGKVVSGRMLYFLPFFMGITLFFLQTNYRYSASNNLGILIQLFIFYQVINRSKRNYLWLGTSLVPVLYFFFGSFFVVFTVPFSIWLIQKREWIKLVISLALVALFFFIGKEYLFFQTTETLFKYPFTAKNIGGQMPLFSGMIATIVLFPAIVKFNSEKITGITIKNIRLIQLTPLLVIAVCAFLVVQKIDTKNAHYFKSEKLFLEGRFEQLITLNTKFPSKNTLTAFLNNLALAESGHLADSFYRFPQSPEGATLFLKWEMIGEVLKRGGYFYYTIGMINEAQRWAYEYMVMKGYSPETLKMLIKTDLIKGKYKIAEKYISILEKSIFYRTEARELRELLYNDEAISKHPELGKKQRFDVEHDFFVQTDNPAANLNTILEGDSSNIPAIEYKLCWLMLQKDMQGIVEMLPLMEKAGYSAMPKNVEEVVVSYKLMKVGEMPELQRLKVSKQAEQRFNSFYRTFLQNQNNRQQAQMALARNFADTYWYYVFFSS